MLWPCCVQYCGGGELYGLLMSQPNKRLSEAHMKFYVAEILLALQYLHLLGFVYRCASESQAWAETAATAACCGQ